MTPEQLKEAHRIFSSKGGTNRMAKLSKKERSELGKKAVRIREEKRKANK